LALRPAQRWMWVGAGWAALCGAVASGGLHLAGGTLIRLPALLLLADALLGAVWTTLADAADRLIAPSQGKDRTPGESGNPDNERVSGDGVNSAPPSGSVGLMARAAPLPAWAGRLAARARLGTAAVARELQPWLITVGAALAVALLLGPAVVLLTGLGVLFPLVVAFAFGGHPLRGGLTRATVEVLLPWSLGLAAFTSLPVVDEGGLADLAVAMSLWALEHGTRLALGGLFAVAYYGLLTLDQPTGQRWRRSLLNLSQGFAVVLLVAWQRPLLAGGAALLWLAQFPFQPYLRLGHVRWYLHSTQWFVMGVMLAASMAAGLR